MEPKEFDFEFPRGDTCPFEFELTDAENNLIETKDDCEIYFTVKKSFNTPEYVFQKKYSMGEIINDKGKCHLIIEHTDTAEMKFGRYVYDVQFESGDYVKTILLGQIELTKESTWISNE